MSLDLQPCLRLGDAVAFILDGVGKTADARDAAASATLSRYAGAPVYLSRRASGRPALPPPWRELGVSLAHRNDIMVCGFSNAHDVGVDIEWCDPSLDIMRLAQDHFAVGESAALSKMVDHERHDLFFRLWSVKEAILKATGRGIHDGVSHIDCSGALNLLVSDGAEAPIVAGPRIARAAVRIMTKNNGRRYSTALAILD